jgi:hypothetical protein
MVVGPGKAQAVYVRYKIHIVPRVDARKKELYAVFLLPLLRGAAGVSVPQFFSIIEEDETVDGGDARRR